MIFEPNLYLCKLPQVLCPFFAVFAVLLDVVRADGTNGATMVA